MKWLLELCPIVGAIGGMLVGGFIASNTDSSFWAILSVLVCTILGLWGGFNLRISFDDENDNSSKKNKPIQPTFTRNTTSTTYKENGNIKTINPNESILGNLTDKQRMSFTNLLCLIARIDGSFNAKEANYLSSCHLGFSLEQCISYLDITGMEQIFEDLRQLTSSQQEYLLFSALELIYCDGKANRMEMESLALAFEKLGYSEDDILEISHKNVMLMKKLKSIHNS
jgi:uncharacterized tellurite resistance protein B-like protein